MCIKRCFFSTIVFLLHQSMGYLLWSDFPLLYWKIESLEELRNEGDLSKCRERKSAKNMLNMNVRKASNWNFEVKRLLAYVEGIKKIDVYWQLRVGRIKKTFSWFAKRIDFRTKCLIMHTFSLYQSEQRKNAENKCKWLNKTKEKTEEGEEKNNKWIGKMSVQYGKHRTRKENSSRATLLKGRMSALSNLHIYFSFDSFVLFVCRLHTHSVDCILIHTHT